MLLVASHCSTVFPCVRERQGGREYKVHRAQVQQQQEGTEKGVLKLFLCISEHGVLLRMC